MKKKCFVPWSAGVLVFLVVVILAMIVPSTANAEQVEAVQREVYCRSASDTVSTLNGKLFRYRYMIEMTRELVTARIETSDLADNGFGQLSCILEATIYLPDEDVFVTQTDYTNNWYQSRGRISNEVEYEGHTVTGEIVSATATYFISGNMAGTLTVGQEK